MRFLISVAILGLLAAPAVADWDPGDPYKMHYPQTPQAVGGWLIDCNSYQPIFAPLAADDWQCTSTGPVSDLHFWGGWDESRPTGPPDGNYSFVVKIHSDIPAPGQFGYSMPGDVLWERQFFPGEYTNRVWEDYTSHPDDLGYHMQLGGPLWRMHQQAPLYQYNITDIVDPFIQEEGTIYWLEIQLIADSVYEWGWMTSDVPWNDNAVEVKFHSGGWNWYELFEYDDPVNYPDGLDLAFVITPEPTSLLLLLAGSLAVLRRR
jgi:hypothetical protein